MAQEGITIELRGLREVVAKLESLGKRKGLAAVRKGLRAGANVTTAAARSAAPVKSGQTRKAVKTRSMKRSRRGIGVRTTLGAGFYKGKTFYGAFVEFGHRVGSRKSIGGKANVGTAVDTRQRVPGQHWMERSAKETMPKAASVAEKAMVDAIERAASA